MPKLRTQNEILLIISAIGVSPFADAVGTDVEGGLVPQKLGAALV